MCQSFAELGHSVYSLNNAKTDSLKDAVKQLHCSLDLIVIELYGADYPFKKDFGADDAVNCPVAAYCIDSVLNEFWLRYAVSLFDYVFVDQIQSVAAFAKYGIKAHWLPLGIWDSAFVTAKEKIHDITFVGRVNSERRKRSNLLHYLSKHVKINYHDNISFKEMQNCHARSKIVLNENLFNGLTLRVFQGLAANSVVFTEEKSLGAERFFHDGKDLCYYCADNLLDKITDVLQHFALYEEIAQNGYEKCKKDHTFKVRAQTLLDYVGKEENKNFSFSMPQKRFFAVKARCRHILRFGGSLAEATRNLNAFAAEDTEWKAFALAELACLHAEFIGISGAEKLYCRALSVCRHWEICLKMAQICLYKNEIGLAQKYVDYALSNNFSFLGDTFSSALKGAGNYFELLYIIAQLYLFAGKNFELGFSKQFENKFPETAFETAMLIWKHVPDSSVMDIMLKSLKPFGLEAQLLDQMEYGIAKGVLTEEQVSLAAELAKQNYDMDFQKRIARTD